MIEGKNLKLTSINYMSVFKKHVHHDSFFPLSCFPSISVSLKCLFSTLFAINLRKNTEFNACDVITKFDKLRAFLY